MSSTFEGANDAEIPIDKSLSVQENYDSDASLDSELEYRMSALDCLHSQNKPSNANLLIEHELSQYEKFTRAQWISCKI